MMEVTNPIGVNVVYGPYFSEEITAWVRRVKIEHQITQTVRHLRQPTELEAQKAVLQPIFNMAALATRPEED